MVEYEIKEDRRAALLMTAEEVLTLRHCVLEALEALSDAEFLIRTGGAKPEAEDLLAVLKQISRDLVSRQGG